ncbi:hypothetical protein K1719_018586 [Acacia pycnantha]|nr:hypothetical protein K1719_018586 [Acacia pycnantha]
MLLYFRDIRARKARTPSWFMLGCPISSGIILVVISHRLFPPLDHLRLSNLCLCWIIFSTRQISQTLPSNSCLRWIVFVVNIDGLMIRGGKDHLHPQISDSFLHCIFFVFICQIHASAFVLLKSHRLFPQIHASLMDSHKAPSYCYYIISIYERVPNSSHLTPSKV